jgi:acyl carrier protein
MQTTEIEREVRTFLVNNYLFGRSEALGGNDSLLDNVIDSTGVLELVVFIQDTFGVTVEDDEVVPDNIESVAKIVAYVERKIGKKAAVQTGR